MSRFRGTLLGLGLLAAVSCRIEDYTPTGSRHDEEAVQGIVTRYARTLSDRDWVAARRLFWADATYSGPMLPMDNDSHQAVPGLQSVAIARVQPASRNVAACPQRIVRE